MMRYDIRFGDRCLPTFDALGERFQELTVKAIFTAQFPDYKFDVKNQASFARWHICRRPYSSAEDGVTD